MAKLDEPLSIKGMHIRNRLVFPPITTNYATSEGLVTEEILSFYRQRAAGVGMVIVEATVVRRDGRITPYSLGIWCDEQVPGLARLTEAIKREGAAAVVQIAFAGARGVPSEEGIRGASPSGVRLRADVEPVVLTPEQIAEITEAFAAAAFRAQKAGFDAVEVHGAHFYLISQFLSPVTNKREDRYGGDTARRATFAIEVVRAIRDRVGERYPILFRLNAYETLEGGLDPAEAAAISRLLEEAGVDAIDASAMLQCSWQETDGRRYLQAVSVLSKDQPRGANVPSAAQIKQAVHIPVITVGKLGEGELASQVVSNGLADMVAIGRQMIADPNTAVKILSGRSDEIVWCKECLSCLTSVVRRYGPLKCSVNKNPAGVPVYS